MTELDNVELVPDTVRGFKRLTISPDGLLVSPLYKTVMSDEWMRFQCECPFTNHGSFQPNSTCGWYAANSVKGTSPYSRHKYEAIAILEGKGNVIRGDAGFRSEYARVVGIKLVSNLEKPPSAKSWPLFFMITLMFTTCTWLMLTQKEAVYIAMMMMVCAMSIMAYLLSYYFTLRELKQGKEELKNDVVPRVQAQYPHLRILDETEFAAYEEALR